MTTKDKCILGFLVTFFFMMCLLQYYSHKTSRATHDQAHKEWILSEQRVCAPGARYSVIKLDGSLTCVYDDRNRYGWANRSKRVEVN